MNPHSDRAPPRLFSLPVIVILVAMIAGILFFLYRQASPYLSTDQSGEVLKSQFANQWQANFYQMLRAENVSPAAVLKLAQELSSNGYWAESARLLAEKLMDPPFAELEGSQLAELRLQNSLSAYYAASAKKGADFEQQKLEVRDQLQAMGDLKSLDSDQLGKLAKQSTDFELWSQAAKLYAALAEKTSENAAKQWATAAKWAHQAGEEETAEAYMAKAFTTAGSEDEKRLYQYAWMQQAVFAGKTADVEKQVRAQTGDTALNKVALEKLAEISQRLTHPELTAQLYANLAEEDQPAQQQRWLEKAGYWASQAGLHAKAATYNEQALQLAQVPSEIHALQVRLLDNWMQAKKPAKALEIARELLDNPNSDLGMLDTGIQTALAAKSVPDAREWNKRYLELNPEEAKAYLRQADIEILAKDHKQALFYVKEAVRLEPDNLVARERWAYLAERNGDKQLALELWDWLYQKTGKADYQRNRIYVAQTSLQGHGLDYLLKQAQEKPLPVKTAASVFSALTQKSPEQAETFMLDYLQRHAITDMTLWKYLADWQVGQKRLTQALQTWQQHEATFGASNQTRLARLQVLWELKDKEQAKAVMASLENPVLAEMTPYQLEILAELHWQNKDYAQAQQYYSHLVQTITEKTPVATRTSYYTRLAETQKEQGDDPGALQTLQSAWQATHEPDLLLNALQMAMDTHQPDQANDLLKQVAQQEQLFEMNGRYWLLRGQLAIQQKQPEQAREYYQHLLLVENKPSLLRQQGLMQALELAQQDKDHTDFDHYFQELEGMHLEKAQQARLYELALARALTDKDAARMTALLEKAKSRQVALSGWLQMAVAMERQDKATVDQLLKTYKDDLSLGDRVSALVMLGRGNEAYKEAKQAIGQAKNDEERELARKLSLSLAEGRVSSITANVRTQHMQGLNMQEQTLTYHHGKISDELPVDYSLEASHGRLSGDVVQNGAQNEVRVKGSLHWQNESQQVNASVGLNQRDGQTKPEASIGYRQQFTDSVAGSVIYGYQQTPQENAWLRANGLRNQLQVGAEVKLGENNVAQVAGWQSDFNDRNSGKSLASAKGGRVSLVHRQSMDNQREWFVGVQGNAEYYESAHDLDASQREGIPDDNRGLALLAGIGNGALGTTTLPPQDQTLRYNLSASLGKQWPNGESTRHVEATVGKRISSADELSMGTFYDKGSNTEKDYGLFMQYRKWLDFDEEAPNRGG